MAKFRLLAGQHIQPDPDWEPSKEEERAAERAGVVLRPPSRTYNAGQIVESDADLVERFGAQKFTLVSGTPSRGSKDKRRQTLETQGDVTGLNERESAAVFPHGQVSTGFQSTSGTPEGESISGPDSDTPEERQGRAPQQGKAGATEGRVPQGNPEEEQGIPPKSSKVAGSPQQQASKDTGKAAQKAQAKGEDDLNDMTVEELREHAADEEINLHGASTKADIIKAIKKEQKK